MTASTIPADITRAVDEAPLSGAHIRLLIIAFAIIVIDGYCLIAPGFAAPSIARAWQIADESRLGIVLAASLLGMIIGAPLFGFIGDRFGRRPAILIAIAVFAGFTLLSGFARDPMELSLIRLVDGIGIGGVASNVISLVSESTPRRLRTLFVMTTLTGTSVGGALPAAVAVLAPEDLIWQSIFVVGGLGGVLLLLLAFVTLPESPSYLLTRGREAKARAILRHLAPQRAWDTPIALIATSATHTPKASPAALFSDGLGLITPLLWLLNFSNFLVIFFVVSWTPYLLEQAMMTSEKAALVNATFSFGGVAGGLFVARFMDRRGFLAIAAMFSLGAPAVAAIGTLGVVNLQLLLLAAALAGAAVVGNQFALSAMSTMIYPSDRRSAGAGWSLAVGRIGSCVGPLIGGVLIAAAFGLPVLYAIAATPMIVGALACLVMWRLYKTDVQQSASRPAPAAT